MPRKYDKKTQSKVEDVMHEYKEGKLKSGRSGKKVTNRKQAIAIGLSEARKAGGKAPAAPSGKNRKSRASVMKKAHRSKTTSANKQRGKRQPSGNKGPNTKPGRKTRSTKR